jgi:hypothetical protein
MFLSVIVTLKVWFCPMSVELSDALMLIALGSREMAGTKMCGEKAIRNEAAEAASNITAKMTGLGRLATTPLNQDHLPL